MPASDLSLLDLLFRRHWKELLAFAERKAGYDAEDLVQDAFLRLIQRPDLNTIENPRAYLFKTTTNLGINQFHRGRVRENPLSLEAVEPACLDSGKPQVETVVDGVLRLEQFINVLAELPETCQDAFILHKLDGLTYPEVGKALGISAKTAQRHVDKAWQHCLKKLAFQLD